MGPLVVVRGDCSGAVGGWVVAGCDAVKLTGAKLKSMGLGFEESDELGAGSFCSGSWWDVVGCNPGRLVDGLEEVV